MRTARSIENEKQSGYAYVRNNSICWDFNKKNYVEVDSDRIVVIGEYTTAEGPYRDDWFIVFVTTDGNCHNISWYSENMNEVSKFLTEKFQTDFNISFLTSSGYWKSIVRYPKHLESQELFEVVPPSKEEIRKSIWNQFKNIFGLLPNSVKLAGAVQNEIKLHINKSSR